MKLSKKVLGICLGVMSLALTACGAKAHNFSEVWSGDADAHWHACTDAGCTERSHEKEHFWDGGELTVVPTCETAGTLTYTCLVCGATKTRTIDALGHLYGEGFEFDATSHWKICCDCGLKSFVGLHEWDELEVLYEPTCTIPGGAQHRCLVCGFVEFVELEPCGHEFSAIGYDDVSHYLVCAHECCDEKIMAQPHTFGAWVEDPELHGKHRTCTGCGYVQFLDYEDFDY